MSPVSTYAEREGQRKLTRARVNQVNSPFSLVMAPSEKNGYACVTHLSSSFDPGVAPVSLWPSRHDGFASERAEVRV
jgi:hypothetical protein